jgi:transcriptional regulator with XRE-family HTH domain
MPREPGLVFGLPDRLSEAIHASGLPTPQICDAVGIERKSLYSWKAGHSAPDAIRLAKLCVLLHVSADWLLGIKSTK